MKTKIESIILKILLLVFGLGTMFVGVYVLPLIAEEMISMYPTFENSKLTTLYIGQSLLVLLLIGIVTIIYLLRLFDKGQTFNTKFLKGLEALVIMCLIAFIGILSLYIYISSFGGPDPLTALTMISVAIFTLILATVIMLIRAIVKNAITYKTDYDLTV